MKIKYEKPQWRRKTVPTHQKSVKIPVRLFRDERVNFNKLLALSTSASVYKRSFQGHEILFFISKIRGDFECRIWIADGFIPRYFPIKIYFFRFINLEVQSQQNENLKNSQILTKKFLIFLTWTLLIDLKWTRPWTYSSGPTDNRQFLLRTDRVVSWATERTSRKKRRKFKDVFSRKRTSLVLKMDIFNSKNEVLITVKHYNNVLLCTSTFKT